MSEYNCYLCASDEGILLDIFGDAGKAFREYIETCLSVKVKQSDSASTKICHKCAYELESCERFLAKYRRFKVSVEGNSASKRRGHCWLCGETPKKLRLLQVNQGNSLKTLLHKLQQIFLEDFLKENTPKLSVCLDCRYNIDVLSDLKIIHSESVKKLQDVNENGLKLSDLPKTKTSVVTRKTTCIPQPKLNGHSSYESDTSTTSSSSSNTLTMPLKRKRMRSLKEPVRMEKTTGVGFRSCEECNTQVEHGIDMYRYHRSGQTVCRDCWLTVDPEKISNGKRKRLASSNPESGTKLCAVFLKDVLSNPSKYSNIYKVENDKDGNKTFLITDESSENEEKDKTVPKLLRSRAAHSSTPAISETITETRRRVKRSFPKEIKIEPQPVKKRRPRISDASVETPPVPAKITRARNRLAVVSDSPIKTRSGRSSCESTTTSTSLSPETRKKNPPAKKTARAVRDAGSKKPLSDNRSHESESSSNENQSLAERAKVAKDKKKEKITATKNRDQRAVRRTRSNSFTASTVATPDTTHLEGNSSKAFPTPLDSRKTEKGSKISKTRTKNAKSDSELDKPYMCSICRLGCQNKLVGKSHELTHEKQPEVKLRRVDVIAAVAPPETVVEETPLEVSISKEGEKREESHDEENENSAVVENPEPPEEATETPEIDISTSEKPVSEEKTGSSAVREEAEDEKMERKLDDGKENEEETRLPMGEEEETRLPMGKEEETRLSMGKEEETMDQTSNFVDKHEPLSQENKPDTNESDENAANENKENDNSGEIINKEKEDETNDEVKESSVETKEPRKVEMEPPEATTLPQVEPAEKMDVTHSSEDVEEKTQNDENEKMLEAAEPMEVTETEEEEKSIEERVEFVVEDVEKAEQDNYEKDTKAADAGHQEEPDQETEVENSITETASETNKTPEVIETVGGDTKEEENENLNEKDRKEKEREELIENHEEEKENGELNGKGEEETEKSNRGDEEAEEPEENVDSSRDEEEEEEEKVSLVVDESKEDEAEQSKTEDEEKKEKNTKTDEIAEADQSSDESSRIATECIREVFDLANAEVKKRLENENSKQDKSTIAETLENISLEIQNGSDMPSLEIEPASNDKS